MAYGSRPYERDRVYSDISQADSKKIVDDVLRLSSVVYGIEACRGYWSARWYLIELSAQSYEMTTQLCNVTPCSLAQNFGAA